MRVLVVEDETDLGEVFRDFLSELGHQAVLVRSAEAALGKLQTERPDAIILDIQLPGMSGLDFMQLRPVRESGLPIVAVSGVVSESQARECLRLGALDFVGKPVPLERLHDVLFFLEPHAINRMRDDQARHAEDEVFPLPHHVHAQQPAGGARGKPEQRLDGAAGLASRAQLEDLTEEHQDGDHRRRLEVEPDLAAVGPERLREEVGRDRRHDAVGPGRAGPQRDQREHVEAAVQDGHPRPLEEGPAAPQDDGRRQNQLEPGDGPR